MPLARGSPTCIPLLLLADARFSISEAVESLHSLLFGKTSSRPRVQIASWRQADRGHSNAHVGLQSLSYFPYALLSLPVLPLVFSSSARKVIRHMSYGPQNILSSVFTLRFLNHSLFPLCTAPTPTQKMQVWQKLILSREFGKDFSDRDAPTQTSPLFPKIFQTIPGGHDGHLSLTMAADALNGHGMAWHGLGLGLGHMALYRFLVGLSSHLVIMLCSQFISYVSTGIVRKGPPWLYFSTM